VPVGKTELEGLHPPGHVVQAQVVEQALIRLRHRLEADAARAPDGAGEQRVRADVGADVDEQVGRQRRVQHVCHVRELVQPAVHVARESRLPQPHDEAGVIDPVVDDPAGHQARPQLPLDERQEGVGLATAVQRMAGDELERADKGHAADSA
jgi:hypothetical protein